MNLGSNSDWFFFLALLAQGSPLVESCGAAAKSIRQSIQEWDSLQTGWNDFEPETLAGRELTDQL